MAAKSPTSVRAREIIGVDQFSKRREVFDKYDTVFLPLPSPTSPSPAYHDGEPILTSNRAKTTTNFKRNHPVTSSMREDRTDERTYDIRPRKYSDNFTSELNQSDDVDYRYSMMERNRRLSRMRREFLKSNLHEPTEDSPFKRTGTRSSMPARTGPVDYKIESPTIYKFPFAEPFTPTSTRKILRIVSNEVDGKENEDPILRKHNSLSTENDGTQIDHQKLFEELVKRYSPQRKPIDWTLPPTRPRVVGSIPKSTSSAEKSSKGLPTSGDDDVFEKNGLPNGDKPTSIENVKVIKNGPSSGETDSVKELAEKNDKVPELSPLAAKMTKETGKKPHHNHTTDMNIPELLEKMTEDGESLENHKKQTKVKRKRSFLDKLLGRKKDK